MKLILITIIGLLFTFNLCFAQTLKGNKKDLQTILKNTEEFSKYIIASDYDNIAKSYTDDAKIFPNNRDILQGEAIINYWKLPEGVKISHHKVTQTEITVEGDTAYDYGYYEGKTQQEDGQISSWQGKYVIIWKKIDGNWKMYLDIWNSIPSN